MLEEADTQASTFGGTLDQTWNVGYHEGAGVLATHHTQVRHQSSEGVIGYLGTGGGHGTDKGGLASIGQTQHADIGQQQQFQLQSTHFTRRTAALLARRPVD